MSFLFFELLTSKDKHNKLTSCLTDAVTVSNKKCMSVFLCVCVPGIVSTGDEDEAEGPVEKANGEVQRRRGAGLRRSGQVGSDSREVDVTQILGGFVNTASFFPLSSAS